MEQEIKNPVITKSNYEYETFDVGNKALVLGDKEDDVMVMIDQLGLKGQKQLVKNQAGLVIPFPKMNTYEERVWEIYCPAKVKLEEYDGSPIPYEVLTLLQLIKDKKYFDTAKNTATKKITGWVEVWSEAREDVDPLIVGVLGTQTKYDWGWGSTDKAYYLVARWGVSLRKFEDIADISIKRWKNARKAKAQAVIDTLDASANNHFYDGRFVADYTDKPIDLSDIPF